MPEEFECECKTDLCDLIHGNVLDLDLKKNDCEIRADITVGRKHCVRVWGQVKDCEVVPVKEALVKLVKIHFECGKLEYEGVAHTVTDCMGFYQFEICVPYEECKYKILAGKPATGNERVIEKEVCNVCKKPPCFE